MISVHLRKANILLRSKDYDQSLKQYQLSCRISLGQTYLNCISISLKGYNHFCLLEYQQAEKCYNSALKLYPFDSTTLFRRATLYLKTKQYEKAAFDILRLSEIEPQAMRVGVLIMEMKQKAGSIWKSQNEKDPFRKEEESHDEVEVDEEQALNFSNLKKIDRVSVKNIPSFGNKRSSQINFKEDEIIEYEQSEQSRDSNIGKYEEMEKFNKSEELEELELNSMQSDQPSVVKFVVSKNFKKPKKSILKCSIAYRLPQTSELSTIKTAPPVLINPSKVRDIDGKKLSSLRLIRFSATVGKSQILRPNPHSKPRKSCMKNVSMIVNPNSKVTINQPRASSSHSRLSFSQLRNLDGKYLFQKKNSRGADSSADESDEYNIFGNKCEKQLHEELMKIKSFVGSVNEEQESEEKMFRPKKSILKVKNVSVIEKDKSVIQSSINKKKSVIFK